MRRPADLEPRPGPTPRALVALLLAVGLLHGLLLVRWTSTRADRFGAPAPVLPAMQVRTLAVAPAPAPRRPVDAVPRPVRPTPAEEPARSPQMRAPPAMRALTPPMDEPARPSPPEARPSPPPAAPEHDGDEAPIAAGETAPPVYATRLPGDASLRYRLQRGALSGDAALVWRSDGERYTLDFEARGGAVSGRALIEQHSQGSLDAGGLAPERFADRRRGRGPQSAQFDRAAGAVRFSGPSHTYPAWPGAQDRLGWIVQLAAIQAAAVQQPPDEPLAEVVLFVVGARGGAGWWTFRRIGREPVVLPSGETVQAWHFERRPAVPRDLHVEAWLDPARGFWPVRLRWRPALGGPPLELLLSADPDSQARR